MNKLIVVGLMGLSASVAGCANTGGFRDRSELVAAPPSCSPLRFEIYFADGQARLTEAARQAVGMTAAQLQGCDIRSVRVLGLADARGGAAANLTLSERRAQATAQALVGAGLPAPAFDLAAAGDSGAVTPEGLSEPLRRRTEVLIDAAAPQ